MTDRKKHDTFDADALLKAASQDTDMPDGLAVRVIADAARYQPARRRSIALQVAHIPRWVSALGGWQGLGGMVAAGCAGFWIGVSPPAGIVDPGARLLGHDGSQAEIETVELSAFGWDTEGN